jgi:nucleolar GTP-binding protein
MFVVNKIDKRKPEDLEGEDKALFEEILSDPEITLAQTSCYTDEGVMDLRNVACDKLLAARVEQKLKGVKIQSVINKLHLAEPVKRDDRERPAFIPESVLNRSVAEEEPKKLMRDIERENGGAGVFNVDLKANYILKKEEWKYDIIPEIMDGKNVADFIDPEIEEKLEALEREEERLVAEGFYEVDSGPEDEDTKMIMDAATKLKNKQKIIRQENILKKVKNRSTLTRADTTRVIIFNCRVHDWINSKLN